MALSVACATQMAQQSASKLTYIPDPYNKSYGKLVAVSDSGACPQPSTDEGRPICACHYEIVKGEIAKSCGHLYHGTCVRMHPTCLFCDREHILATRRHHRPPVPVLPSDSNLPIVRELLLASGMIRLSLILTRQVRLSAAVLTAAGMDSMRVLGPRGVTLHDLYTLGYRTVDDLKALGFNGSYLKRKSAFAPEALYHWYHATPVDLHIKLDITAQTLREAEYTPQEVAALGLTFPDLMAMGLNKNLLLEFKWDLDAMVEALGSPRPYADSFDMTLRDAMLVPEWTAYQLKEYFGCDFSGTVFQF